MPLKLAISLNPLIRTMGWKLDNLKTCLNIVRYTSLEVSRIFREHTLTNINKNRGTFPLNNEEFGFWLAGLIEADGCFNYKQIVIVGNIREITMLENLSKRIGGKIKGIKGKKACKLVISNSKEIENIFNLINGKLRYQYKIDMLKSNILKQIKCLEHLNLRLSTVDNRHNLNKTHWFAGFTTGDGSFQIKILKRKLMSSLKNNHKIEIRLNYQLDQKSDHILNQIKECFGGNVYYRSNLDVYYYGSTSFPVNDKLINYFDKFRVSGWKWINYLKWRKAWALIKNKKHLTDSGILEIINIKNSMNNKG